MSVCREYDRFGVVVREVDGITVMVKGEKTLVVKARSNRGVQVGICDRDRLAETVRWAVDTVKDSRKEKVS